MCQRRNKAHAGEFMLALVVTFILTLGLAGMHYLQGVEIGRDLAEQYCTSEIPVDKLVRGLVIQTDGSPFKRNGAVQAVKDYDCDWYDIKQLEITVND